MSTSSGDAKLTALAKANRVLEDQLSRDASKVPDPADIIMGVSSSSTYAPAPSHAWTPFELRRTMMIPEELFSELEPTRSRCSMGLFPEIDRAWIALNNRLFLWDYVTSKDSLQSFPEQPSNVTYVGLVKPKTGIFIDSMLYLLILCTENALIVLGLAKPEAPTDPASNSQEFVVYDTELRFPTENVPMTSIVGTNSGRTFMCGITDGYLYELQYQATEGWFGGKSSLHNHSVSGVSSFIPSLFSSVSSEFITQLEIDKSRDLLYALTNQNTITLYNVAGKVTAPLQKIATASNLAKHAQTLCPPLGQTTINIVSLAAIPSDESSSIHLVASTANGIRLYFTTMRRTYSAYGTATTFAGGASGLELVHVRMGPSGLFDPRSIQGGLSDSMYRSSPSGMGTAGGKFAPWHLTMLNAGGYHGGMFLATQTTDEMEQDILLCTAPDLPRVANLKQPPGAPVAPTASSAPTPYYGSAPASTRATFSESTFLVPLIGKACAVAHLPAARLPTPPSSSRTPGTNWNELANQFSGYTEQFLVMTNDSLSVISKRRAIDTLRELIDAVRRGDDEGIVTQFFEQFGRDQACAMCLALACGNSFAISGFTQAPLSSSNAFAKPQMADVAVDEGLALAAKTIFYEFGQQPAVYPGTSTVTFSGRHEGLALYFARLIRPIWKSKITTGPTNNQSSNLSPSVLTIVQKDLQALMSFLDRNPQLFTPPGNYSLHGSVDGQFGAWKDEETSVAQLRELLSLTIEAISFIVLLIDYKLPDTVNLLEPSLQQKLQTMTWEELLTQQSGRDVGKALVTAVINQQISQQISIDAISEILQARCPNFCSTDDVMMYKAVESLRRAKETRSASERNDSLRESLRLLLKSTRNLRAALDEICADYRDLSFPDGAVLLPLQCANDWDADFQGRDYFASGSTSEQDPRRSAYETRLRCYDLILKTLSAFDDRFNAATSDVTEAQIPQDAAYRLALDSADPIFHSYLYDWFVAKGRTDLLLDIRTPFIEEYLRREPRSWEKCELLWQFYVNHGHFLNAAEALADLAEGRDFGMTLEKRIEYLSLALGNAKSHQASEYDSGHQAPVELLTDLDEKLEVANVQLDIYEQMKGFRGLGESALKEITALGTTLMDVNALYHRYADPYSLYDMKLLILKVSEHRDAQIVSSTWRAIFENCESLMSVCPVDHQTFLTLSILGQRLYPSDIAFPLDLVCSLLEDFAWDHRASISVGWAPQTLLEAHIPYEVIFEALYTLREAGQPPYHMKDREVFLISDITYLTNSWLTEALRLNSSPYSDPSGSRALVGRFPADIIDQALTQYMELLPTGAETEATRRLLGDMQQRIRARF
ncbi:nucleoporin-domain-containing protein [Clavulina sp. PMI_390]|nr:nucleoporin-domain-containing protein [Clavulina sp. PMI_390]